MVVGTGTGVASIGFGGAGAIAGAGVGMTAGINAPPSSEGIGRATGIGIAAGAIAGATAAMMSCEKGKGGASTAFTGAAAGAIAGGSAALGISCLGTGLGASAGAKEAGSAALAGPVGMMGVGATDSAGGSQATYDCWKPVVHDTSKELSSGMALRDLVSHKNIAKVFITPRDPVGLPHIILENIWDEKFEIEYLVILETGKFVCHAKPVFV